MMIEGQPAMVAVWWYSVVPPWLYGGAAWATMVVQ